MQVNSKGPDNIYPLMKACEAGSMEIVDVLLEEEANVNATNVVGMSSLYYACEGGHIDIAEKLLAHGADPSLGGGEEDLKEPFDLISDPAVRKRLEETAEKYYEVRKSRSKSFFATPNQKGKDRRASLAASRRQSLAKRNPEMNPEDMDVPLLGRKDSESFMFDAVRTTKISLRTRERSISTELRG
jgi:hypothetical protein